MIRDPVRGRRADAWDGISRASLSARRSNRARRITLLGELAALLGLKQRRLTGSLDLSASNLRRLGRTLSAGDTVPRHAPARGPDAVRSGGSESDWNGLLPAYFAE
jgi:hypothetical protein